MTSGINESDDYKRGWYDGYKAAKQATGWNPQPFMPMPVTEPQIKCDKCGMVWKGVMGYVCPRQDCIVQPKTVAATSWPHTSRTTGTTEDREWQRDHERSKY